MQASLLGCAGCFRAAQTPPSPMDLDPPPVWSDDHSTAAERARLPRILCVPAGPADAGAGSVRPRALAPLSPASEGDTMDIGRQLAGARPVT